MAPSNRQHLLLFSSTSLILICFLVSSEASTPNGQKNEAKEPPVIKRAASLDDSFFGNVDIERIKEAHRKAMQSSFFGGKSSSEPKVDANKSSGGQSRPSTDPQSEDEKRRKKPEEHQEFVPPFKHQEKGEKNEEKKNNSTPPPISSYETAPKFYCTKRALWSYMRIVRTIYNRLETLTIAENSNYHHQYTLQLTVSAEEAHQLERHIVSLQGVLADYKPSGKKDEEEEHSEPEKIRRFCANLDAIEDPTVRLIERTVMSDTTVKSRKTKIFWGTSLSIWISSHLNMKSVTLTVFVLITSLTVYFFFLRAGVPRSRKYIFGIVLLVLGLSLVQFFNQEKTKFLAEKRKELNIVLDAALDCGWTEKAGNLLKLNGYHCSKTSSQENAFQPAHIIPETDHEELFWGSHFNILSFLLKWAIWIWLLGPFKEVTLEADRVFELMVDGKTSQNWWDVGAYVRSVLFSTLTKPLWVVGIFFFLYKFGFSIHFFSKWAHRAMNWAMNEEEEEEGGGRANQAVNQAPRDHQAQIPGVGVGGHVPQLPPINIINNHHYHQVPHPFAGVDHQLPRQQPQPAQVIRPRILPVVVDDDDEDAYLTPAED